VTEKVQVGLEAAVARLRTALERIESFAGYGPAKRSLSCRVIGNIAGRALRRE